jgi:hypothetical protein
MFAISFYNVYFRLSIAIICGNPSQLGGAKGSPPVNWINMSGSPAANVFFEFRENMNFQLDLPVIVTNSIEAKAIESRLTRESPSCHRSHP